ncbi:hypothetical protein DHEL01_v209273 [Diaporthe helianthi]|uniref:Uncharacterized protein n=1 Tax=Diaporthe helianthi TaxID=158607 RepID=A0A2P5HPZ5_DIAHE|nr:hypothetical protein DHEL01_v209273 [Diaporthe helianthi]
MAEDSVQFRNGATASAVSTPYGGNLWGGFIIGEGTQKKRAQLGARFESITSGRPSWTSVSEVHPSPHYCR